MKIRIGTRKSALALAQTLTDDVLRGLGGDAAELLGVQVHDAGEADLCLRVVGEGLV